MVLNLAMVAKLENMLLREKLINSLYVTGFAKRGLPDTSNFHTLTIHNLQSE